AVKRAAPADLPKPGKFKEPKAGEAPAAAPAEENKEG
ncbi:MAG: 50S ribosomal protein L3, partial [Rhodoblastus sp.]